MADRGVKLRRPATKGPNRSRRNRDRKPGDTGTVNGGSLRAGKLQAGIGTSKANKGGPGIDGMTVDEVAEYLKQHWPDDPGPAVSGTYKPQPVKRVEIPKPDGGKRKLGVPTVLDRFIQQAVLQVLQRMGPDVLRAQLRVSARRSAHQAVAAAQEYLARDTAGWWTSTWRSFSTGSTTTC